MTQPNRFLNQPVQNIPIPPPQEKGTARKLWDTTKWTVGATANGLTTAAWGASRPLAWAINPIGDGLGSGLASGARRELEQLVQPEGPLAIQLQQTLEQALTKQPPQELLDLRDLIKKSLHSPDTMTNEEIERIHTCMQFLANNDWEQLKRLVPNLTKDEIEFFTAFSEFFSSFASEDMKKAFQETVKESKCRETLETFDAALNQILDNAQGALVQAMTYLKQALLSEQQGVLSEAIKLLQTKCTDPNTGLIRQAVDQMTLLLSKKDGPLELLTTKLTVGEDSIIAQAVMLLKSKLLGQNGIVDELGKRFNDQENGIIIQALNIAKVKLDETLRDSLALLQKELTSEDGLMVKLRNQVSGKENSLLSDAIKLLNDSLFKENDGMVPKLRKELTSEDQGLLAEALKILAKKLNDEKEGIISQGIQLLKQKLNSDDGVLAEAVRLLEFKLNGKDGVIDNLTHRLINENDGTLTKALNLLQSKLNDENNGILAQAVAVFQKRLEAENGPLVLLEKKLTDTESGILAKAITSMTESLKKKDGPLDVLDQRLQKILADALDVLQKKSLDANDGLIAQALKLMSDKLYNENGLLDTLNKHLNDPNTGLIAKTMNSLNQKLLDENGPLAILQKKMLDEKDGVFAKAIDLLNRKLLEKDGTLDTLQKKLLDENGILDQALKMFESRLTDKDRGILVQARNYLSKELTDEKEGILAKAMELLNRKLNEKGGMLDTFEVRLTHEDTGILSRAVGVLQKKLMAQGGVVDQLDERLTGQAHPLLSNARQKLRELQKAIVEGSRSDIKKLSQEAQKLLEQIAAQKALVFTKQPLSDGDLMLVNQLKDQLSLFYAEVPPNQGQMLINVEAGLSAINRYYGSYEGIAARTGAILQETIADAINPLLKRLEDVPKKMVQNVIGMVGAPDAPSVPGEGTVSQFLSYGASILKGFLEKESKLISQQALSSFSSILVLGIKQALSKIEDTPALQAPRKVLTDMIHHLENPQPAAAELSLEELARKRQDDPDAFDANGPLSPWQTLYNRMNRAADTLSPFKIYVNGFLVPRVGKATESVGNVEAAYMDNITALNESIGPAAPPLAQTQDWKTQAEGEKDKLVENVTQYLTLKHIYEDVCHLKPLDERFYLNLLKRANEKGADANEELKKIFFEELTRNNIGLFKQLWSKILYNVFFGYFVKKYVSRASTLYFNEIFTYIDKHKGEHFDTLLNQTMKNFTRYLVILGGAYRKVAHSQEDGLMEEMLKKELEKPESNLKFDTRELYQELAQEVIKKAAGFGIIAWVIRKFIGDPELMVRSIVDKATGALQDNHGYTHAVNSVIREQLQEIWEMLQTQQARRQNGTETESDASLSEGRKEQLTSLMKNFFEILAKSKCDTLTELRDLVEGKLLSANVNKAVDDLFIEEVIQKVMNVIAVTIESLVKEDQSGIQLQKLTYKFANLVNRSFEIGDQEVTLENMKDEEHMIAKLCEQILQTSVQTAVQEKFDFTGKKQQAESNGYVQRLHNRSTEFFATSEVDLAELNLPALDFASLSGQVKIDKVVCQTLAYEKQCSEEVKKARSSKMNLDNKDEISKRYLGIAEQSKPLVQTVIQMNQHSKTLQNLQTIVSKLNSIKLIVSGIPLTLLRPSADATAQDYTNCGNQLQILENHLQELRKLGDLVPLVDQISSQTPHLARAMIDWQKVSQIRSFCIPLAQATSPLLQIATERKQQLSALMMSVDLKNKIAVLRQNMRASFEDAFFIQLSSKLKAIEEATIEQQVDTAYQEFITLANQALAQSAVTLDAAIREYNNSCRAINAAIEASQQLDPNIEVQARRGIRQELDHLDQHLKTLKAWEKEHIKEIPYMNFSAIDMKGLQDWATGLVYGRVQDHLNGMMKLLRHEEIYRYGILNHLLLIPYVQAMRSQS